MTSPTLLAEHITDGPVRVSFDYIGEGLSGEYDENDPTDVALMRLDVLVSATSGYDGEPTDDPEWLYPDHGSICTQIPYETDPAVLNQLLIKAASVLRATIEAGESIKGAMGRLSWWTDTSAQG